MGDNFKINKLELFTKPILHTLIFDFSTQKVGHTPMGVWDFRLQR